MKKLWTGIRSIVNIKHKAIVQVPQIYENNSLIKEPRMIANSFNNFFVNVGKTIDGKILFSGASPEKFFKNLENDSIFISPVVPEEIISIISSLNTKKSIGPHSIPVKLLKVLKAYIAPQQ